MIKRLISTVLAFTLCFSIMAFNVQAATINDKKESLIEGQSVSLIGPKSLFHLTKTQWNSNDTIKVAINYSINDSTNKVVGVLRAYVSEYSSARYKDVRVMRYGIYSNSNKMYVIVSYQYANESNSHGWHNEKISITP